MHRRELYINENKDHANTKYLDKHTGNTKIQSNINNNNDSYKKHSYRSKDVYKMQSVNCVYPADMRETLLSNDNNDNESNNRSVCKTKCRKIIARVNGKYRPY